MNLLTFLRNEKNARKVFGTRELKIIEKQLLGIPLTQSEKNRLSRDIRQKFEFMYKAARFSDEFKLKKGAVIKQMIDATKETILADALAGTIKKIILYGSAVENKLTFRSDIDIAVCFNTINLKEATLFRTRIHGRVPDKMDIQVYNVLPEKIKKEIDEKGQVIYENTR